MVHLVGADAVDEIDQPAAGREIAVMQEHTNVGKVRIHINMVYSAGVECAGTTNDSVHFIAFGQNWGSKFREAALRAQIMGDSHAPGQYRADTVRNIDAWYPAFNVKPGQTLYLAEPERVRIW